MRWYSVSTRLTLMLLGLTLGSVSGLTLVLDIALKNFFIRDAIASLHGQASVLAAQSQSEEALKAQETSRRQLVANCISRFADSFSLLTS